MLSLSTQLIFSPLCFNPVPGAWWDCDGLPDFRIAPWTQTVLFFFLFFFAGCITAVDYMPCAECWSWSFWGGFLDPGWRTVTAALSPPRNAHLWWCSIRRRRRGLSPGNSISTLICLLLSVWNKLGLKENNCNRVRGRGMRARDCNVLHDCISPSTEYRYVVACMYSGFFFVYAFSEKNT